MDCLNPKTLKSKLQFATLLQTSPSKLLFDREQRSKSGLKNYSIVGNLVVVVVVFVLVVALVKNDSIQSKIIPT